MFLINGEPLHEKTHPEEYKWMNQKFEEIRNLGKKTFTFAAFNKRARVMREDGRMIPQRIRKRAVPLQGYVTEATGLGQTWVYVTNMNATKPDGSGGYVPIRGTIALDYTTTFDVQQDIELIFFFLYISRNRHIKIVDKAQENKDKAMMKALRSKAENLIYDVESPVHPEKLGSDQQLKNLALSWGVTNAFDLDSYGVMHALWDRVQKGQANYNRTHRGFYEFIEEVEKYGNTKQRAVISLAIEKGIVRYEGNIWKLIAKGGNEQFLIGVPPKEEAVKDEYVIKYILDNETVFDTVALLAKDKDYHQTLEITDDGRIYEPKKRHELLKEAAKLGWNGPHFRAVSKMSKEELEDLIKEKRTPEDVVSEG